MFVTVTAFAPTRPAGVTAVIDVALTMTTEVAFASSPMLTVAPARNPVPVIMTAVPPAEVPLAWATNVVVGAGYW